MIKNIRDIELIMFGVTLVCAVKCVVDGNTAGAIIGIFAATLNLYMATKEDV